MTDEDRPDDDPTDENGLFDQLNEAAQSFAPLGVNLFAFFRAMMVSGFTADAALQLTMKYLETQLTLYTGPGKE